MNGLKCSAVLASLILAGCAAAAPEIAANASDPAPERDSATEPGETTEANEVARTIALTREELDTSSVITCRELRPLGSNVLVTRCMTQAGWEMYERAQTIQAQELLRRLRGER